MDKQIHKGRCERLREWQKKPFDYEFTTNEVQHCNNCDHEFTGNYCPYCSQKAGEGPIGWHSVRQSVMDIWGLGSRSLPNTLLQLLLRPGYLISDYISGKRQVSFPPVKMLFIVAVIVVFLVYYLLPFVMGSEVDIYGGTTDMIDGFTAWVKKHFVWTYFILSLFYIVPTWIMFRYSPRHTRHTLPQGFFIQIFLLVLNLIVSFIALLPLIYLGYAWYLGISMAVMIAYTTFAYKQLFGYGIWGSLWRYLFALLSSSYMIAALTFLMFKIDFSAYGGDSIEYNKYGLAVSSAFTGLLIMFIGWGINMIATRKARKQLKQQSHAE